MTQPRYGGSSGTGRRMQVDREVLDRMVSKRSKDQSGDGWAKQGAKAGASIGLATGLVRGGIVGSRVAPLYGVGRTAGAAAGAAGMGARHGVIGAGVGALGGLGVQQAQQAGYRKQRAKLKPVAKRVRDYDSEDRRQRRLGMAQAATAGAGIAGLAVGGRGVLRSTRAARKVGGLNGTDKDAISLLRTAHQTGVVAQRRDLAALGGGLAGVAATGAIRQHAENPKNRRYL